MKHAEPRHIQGFWTGPTSGPLKSAVCSGEITPVVKRDGELLDSSLVLHDKLKYEALDRSFLTNLTSPCGVQRSASISAPINPRNQTAGGLKYLSVDQLVTSSLHNLRMRLKKQQRHHRRRSRLSRRCSAGFQLHFPARGGEEDLIHWGGSRWWKKWSYFLKVCTKTLFFSCWSSAAQNFFSAWNACRPPASGSTSDLI